MRVSQESLTAGTRGGRQLRGTLSHVVRGHGISPQAVRQLLCPHKDGLFVTAKLRRGSEKHRAKEKENETERGCVCVETLLHTITVSLQL